MFDFILDLFYPPVCPFCGELLNDKSPVCKECMDFLPFVPENSCSICSRPLPEYALHTCLDCREHKVYFEHAFIPLIYKNEARDCAIALKSDHTYYAKGIAFLMADKILTSPYYENFDCITYVPQSFKGRFARGYNQAEILARELSKILKVPVRSALKRKSAGEDQHLLSRADRLKNVKKCYFKKDKTFSGTALLVDDIYTTGATANYCARLLREMGFDKVYVAIGFIRADD